MSERLQAGQHPDADQLNAFVEHTLPGHEQQETLAHLAICPDCRQIVALSLPPGDQSPSLEPASVRHPWLPRWHPAWLGIPAFAAALILVIFFVRTEQSKVRQTPALSQMAAADKPAPPRTEIPPPEALRSTAPPAQHAVQRRPVAPASQPTPLPQAKQGPAGGVAGGVMGGILGGIGAGPAQVPAPAFAAPSASAGGPSTALAVDRVQAAFSRPSPLPSQLAIFSMAARGSQRLAIDTDHHVFFSDDEGRNWKAVPSPWRGHAVSVALSSAVPFGSARAALKVSSHPAATTGSTLSGTITDPAGAVIPGATLTATNSSGALVGSATTDRNGQYRMEDLAPGRYRIEAQATGFEKQSFVTEMTLSQQAVADATLRVGSAAQTVAIEASPAPADTAGGRENQALKPAVGQTMSRFELTTDEGEHWTSSDGQSWIRR
jgi:Carboxypeptidase regulatory-like domain/Putative zinc-finger